jgi:hypothetical protein
VWESAVDGRRLHFRLVGINNQNFIMQDEETGTWWQQVSGEAIHGPLKGKRLTLVRHDEVSFGIWKAEHPGGRVLRPDSEVEARNEYELPDWERRMRDVRTVTTLPAGSPLEARVLVVGIRVGGTSKAYPLDRVRQFRAIVDEVSGTPLVVVVAEDGRSVRVFDRRVNGRTLELVVTPREGRPTLLDVETASEWDFTGTATSGALRGARLERLPFLLDYWFDWQIYHPRTELFTTWQPARPEVDRLRIPRPSN